jgi:hypothetical protein
VFKELGWTIVEPKLLTHIRAQKGVRLLFRDGKHAPEEASKLYKAMILAGIAVTSEEVTLLEGDSVELFIGFPEETTQPLPTPDRATSPH